MTKNEMISTLTDEYGFSEDQLKDENGKFLTNSVLESMIEKNVKEDLVEEIKVDVEVKPVKSAIEEITNSLSEMVNQEQSKTINDDDEILVMNGVSGELIHRSTRTGRMWKFTRFGQTYKIPFIELMYIYNVRPACFEEGRLIVLNEQVARNFNLTETYKKIITPKNIDGLFDQSIEELEEFLSDIPSAMKSTFISRAKELYGQGKIDSVKKVKFIEETFKISLDDNAPLSDIV